MQKKIVFMGLIFSCLLFADSANAQMVYFADDFETGVSTEWDQVIGQVVADPTSSGQGFVFAGEDVGNGYIQSSLERNGFEFITDVTVTMKWYDDGIHEGEEHIAFIEPQNETGNLGFMMLDTSNFLIFYEDPNNSGQIEVETDIPRTVGWHEFKFVVSGAGAEAYIDGQLVDTIDFITVVENVRMQGERGNAVYWDDVLVESNETPEPAEIIASMDSFLRQGSDDRNEGANPILRVQSSGHNRAVIGFDANAIDEFGTVTKATLRLTIESTNNNWGSGRTVDAHPLNVEFAEGNGKALDVPGPESTRGTGFGVTWRCAVDTDISNQQGDCASAWNGGDFNSATAEGMTHTNNMTGVVEWDVTSDVLLGATSWLVKKTNEGQNGGVSYYSREGANDAEDMTLAPTLILE